MALAFAAAAATCRLGVTGGRGRVTTVGGGVVIILSSSASAGGVAGVTTAGVVVESADASAFCALRISSDADHLHHSSCLRYMYCC